VADFGDTSSFLKPSMPVSPLDTIGKINSIQQQELGISQAKLDQANQGLNYLARAMTSIGPNPGADWKQKYMDVGANAVKLGLVPQNMLHVWEDRVNQAPDSQTMFKQTLGAVADHQQQLQLQTGVNSTAQDNKYNYAGKTDQMTGGFTPGSRMPMQISPGTPGYDESNQQQFEQPAGPSGVVPVPQPRPLSALTTGPTGASVETTGGPNSPPATLAQRSDMTPPAPLKAGPSPMFAASQKMLADDRVSATAKSTALKPLEEAYDIARTIPRTCAGIDTLAKAQSYLTNLGLIKADEKNPAVIYQMLNKNLAQFINNSGSRSDADLAIKESGNANAKTQLQPALLHMAQKIIGREKIEIARPGAFEGNDVGKYSEHSSKFPTSQDERAYTIDKMKPEDARQLYFEMKNKALNGKGADQAEGIKFLKSLTEATKQKLVKGIN
jgi:hypothetical protein